METHVVTISLEFADGCVPSAFSCELWRGNESECRLLAASIPGCSHDHRSVVASEVRCSKICDWEAWVQGAQTLSRL